MRLARLLLQPGIGIKRWAALAFFGVLLVTIGVAFGVSVSVAQVTESLGGRAVDVGRTITFASVLPGLWRGVLFGSAGLLMVTVATLQLYRTLSFGATYSQSEAGVLENLSSYRTRRGGPRLVTIGGGTGLGTLLRGIKRYSEDITAIVTVADDGGSSGRLRNELGMAPPGDARQCLIALSDSEPLMEELLSYRFSAGEGLQGHSMGNLLLAALTDTRGSFHDALQAIARLLAVKGQVVPATTSLDVVLTAETESGKTLIGESAIGQAGEHILNIWLEPRDCQVNPAAVEAIEQADAIIIGPGSLYTSVLPNFLIPGLGRVVDASHAPKVFVCNVATQHGETDGLTAADHLRVFQRHAGVEVTHFLVNDHPLPISPEYHQDAVSIGDITGFSGAVVMRNVVEETMPTRHDPVRLSDAVMDVIRTTPRRAGKGRRRTPQPA